MTVLLLLLVLFRVLEADREVLSEAFLNGLGNVLKLVQLDGLGWTYYLWEPWITLTFFLPDLGLRPVIYESKELKEEDAKVVSFTWSTTVDGGHDALQELGESVKDVEVGDSMLMKGLNELEGVKGVLCGEHQPWVYAVLDEYRT